MKKLLILNTGGTFNKRYNPIKGRLEVPRDAHAPKEVLKSFYNVDVKVRNIIHKDSLEFTDANRKFLAKTVKNSKYKNIIIIHGTDTIDLSAKELKSAGIEKKVVFTGAMVPFSIEQVEATANLSLAVGFLCAKPKNGVYIAMHGAVLKSEKLVKNRAVGKFLRVD